MNDILQILTSGNSKADAQNISKAVINHQYPIEDLLSCFFFKDLRICQRASWPLTFIAEQQPAMLTSYLQKMIDHLDHPNHDAVIRNTVRSWQFMEIPEEFIGSIYEVCFNYLSDPNFAISIRVFSMTTCVNIAERFPELGLELEVFILEQIDHSTAGFRSRGMKALKRLKHILKNNHL
ncbi:MAG: hypothetical protein ACJA01_000808 [Saprospiraceae bacterium]|jgi:hypothetical protein